MGSKVTVPPPSAEERELQRNQAELLALQRQIIEDQRLTNMTILPAVAAAEGFAITVNDRGVITSFSIMPEEQQRRDRAREVETLLAERSLKALRGELPVDPALEEDLRLQEQELRNTLAQQFGPGYETSSPGIETLGEFFRTAEILRSGARTGQLTLAEQLGITREQQEQFRRQSSMDMLRQTAIGDPLTFAGAFGQTARGYGQAQVPFIQQRQMQLQASIANAQSSASMFGAGIGAIGGLFSMFSDPEGKADKVFLFYHELEDGSRIPVYEYTHLGTGERLMGVMSTDVEAIAPWAIGTRFGYDTVDYTALR